MEGGMLTESSEWPRYRTSERKGERRVQIMAGGEEKLQRMRWSWLKNRRSVAHSDSYRGAKAAFLARVKTHDRHARVEQIKSQMSTTTEPSYHAVVAP